MILFSLKCVSECAMWLFVVRNNPEFVKWGDILIFDIYYYL